ncbi:MAG TPA: hypothetical protein VMW27_14280 [Thermoanaerobaculia bacterium]|nr:hypothetical protein [Thermoanaerobaculia bacterium]
MSEQRTHAGKKGTWQRLSAALEANKSELGHLEASRAKFSTLLDRVREIAQGQAALAASKQDLSKQLQVSMDEAGRLANLLRIAVKEHYGPRSEKLTEFGLQPFRGRARKEKPFLPPEDTEA